MNRPPVDWNDLESIRRILVDLRVAVDDADGVVKDMLRKRRRRSLGRATHKEHYRGAHRTMIQLIAYLMPPPPPPPAGDALVH